MQDRAYGKRETRARVREVRLRELGYSDYSAYLNSAAWRDVKRRYRESDLPQICRCGATRWQLHHTTYERVGREELEDLIPLCSDCHALAHTLEAAGIIGLDLFGFYYDRDRGYRNGRVAAARQDALAAERVEIDRGMPLLGASARRKRERGIAMGKLPKKPKPPKPVYTWPRSFAPED